MKAKLEFDLDNVDDRLELDRALNASKLLRAIQEFSERVLRQYRKYGIPKDLLEKLEQEDDTARVAEVFAEHVEGRFYECLEDFEANID